MKSQMNIQNQHLQSIRGFTLIELLVVIAIIGLLASTVLATMTNVRDNARDASIKQQVKSMAQTAELHFNENGSYDLQTSWVGNTGVNPTCATETYVGPRAEDFRRLCAGIVRNYDGLIGTIVHMGVTGGFDAARNYSIMARLNSGEWFCAGSSGRTYEGIADPGTGTWTGAGCFANP